MSYQKVKCLTCMYMCRCYHEYNVHLWLCTSIGSISTFCSIHCQLSCLVIFPLAFADLSQAVEISHWPVVFPLLVVS